jgi:hypothetical protein
MYDIKIPITVKIFLFFWKIMEIPAKRLESSGIVTQHLGWLLHGNSPGVRMDSACLFRE